ncbi:hypothetical protein F8M49_21605 [Rhodococcus zopfii]|uniref:Type I restriction modification DNA specificity domain-containing protein n=1 Tax=Rhodococcus zopfii TaxID=43772 RepID=A0ABU3WUB0_9NOCA|nr:hypothetical protein [Rhodococcus zopfii]
MLILDLAMRGRLTERQDDDKPASELLDRIDRERDRKVAEREIRRRRSLSDPSVDEVPYEVPVTWRWARIGRIAQVIGGATPSAGDPSNFEEPGLPWITPADMSRGKVRLIAYGSRGLSEKGYASCSASLMPAGSLVFSSRAPIGYVAIAANDLCTNQGFKSLVPHAMECSPYLYWALRAFAPMIAARGSGTTFKEVSGGVMESFPLPLPPVQEQHRIVERVDELMDLCDELEEQQAAQVETRSALTAATLHRVSEADQADDLRAAVAVFADSIDLHLAPGKGDLAALKRVRQVILDLAVRGRLTRRDPDDEPATNLLGKIAAERDRLVKAKEIRKPRVLADADPCRQEFNVPKGWEWCRLGQLVLTNEAGWSPVCPPEPRPNDAEWGVLKLSAVSWGKFLAHEHKILGAGLDPRPAIEVRDGDYLMSRANTAALVGRSVVVNDPPPRLMMSDLIVRLGFVDRVTAEYINLLNGTRSVRALYAEVSKGTSDTMRKLSRDQILSTPVPLPPLDEQKRIVDRVEALFAICDQLEQQLLVAEVLRKDLGASVGAHAALADTRNSTT